MTDKTKAQLAPVGKWLSNNVLEMVIILLLTYVISNQNKMEDTVDDLKTRVSITEWAIIQDPTTPEWVKEAILNPRRSGNYKYSNSNQ